MRRFELIEPKSLAEACSLLAENADAKVVAGGTALLTIIKQGLLLPKILVNLKKIRDASWHSPTIVLSKSKTEKSP